MTSALEHVWRGCGPCVLGQAFRTARFQPDSCLGLQRPRPDAGALTIISLRPRRGAQAPACRRSTRARPGWSQWRCCENLAEPCSTACFVGRAGGVGQCFASTQCHILPRELRALTMRSAFIMLGLAAAAMAACREQWPRRPGEKPLPRAALGAVVSRTARASSAQAQQVPQPDGTARLAHFKAYCMGARA